MRALDRDVGQTDLEPLMVADRRHGAHGVSRNLCRVARAAERSSNGADTRDPTVKRQATDQPRAPFRGRSAVVHSCIFRLLARCLTYTW